MEQMPMWCPPTPPQQEADVYIDNTMTFLYDTKVMSEVQLPPVYVRKENKRSRLEAGLLDPRRPPKIPRKEDVIRAPRSLFHPHALFKMRRDLKWQKYRGLARSSGIPGSFMAGKPSKPPSEQPLWHDWTIHEDMALLKVIQNFQRLPLNPNLMTVSPGHTLNWDFVSDYVNTVSITYRSPKQCRQRYESALMQREEGKQIYDNSLRKKKNKNLAMQKFTFQQKSARPMRTSQLYTQDNNSTFSQYMMQRYDALKAIANKRMPTTRTVSTNQQHLKNPKHTALLNECGIDLDHPMMPVEVAARRAERLAREKKMTPEQQAARLQLMKGLGAATAQTSASTSTQQTTATPTSQVVQASAPQITVVQTQPTTVTTVAATVAAPSTPPNALRGQRIIASPIQNSTVVSVSGLSPAQLQAATQRLIVSAAQGQNKAVVGTTQGIQSKTVSPVHLQMIRQAATIKQQLRVQAAQGVKTSTVTIGGQPAVVQFSQAQGSPRAQFVRQGTVTVGGKAAITRTVTESEVAQIVKKQQQLQQQKALAAAVAGGQPTTIQSLSPQVFAQAIQAGTSGAQVATLVKAVSSAGGASQTVTIPVTGVTIATPNKTLTPTIKTNNPQQIRQLALQQQLLAQKKLNAQKLNLAQVAGKGNMQTQLIVGPKPTAMTVTQFQQVIRSPLGVSQGPVVLTKGTPRVIPVNTAQGTKQTIQVVAAGSQGLGTALRPQGTSTLAGALAGIKVQGQTGAQAQQTLLQVSAALQNQGMGVRQGSPVRIQTAGGTPIVAVTVQSPSTLQQGNTSQSPGAEQD